MGRGEAALHLLVKQLLPADSQYQVLTFDADRCNFHLLMPALKFFTAGKIILI
jgi:hypothetical protein